MNADELIQLLGKRPGSSREELKGLARNHDVLRFFLNASGRGEIAEVFRDEYPGWREQASLPASPGAVGVPVTLDHQRKLPMAAEAAVLPVRWTYAAEQSGMLPASLVDCARRVLDRARQSPRWQDQYRDRLQADWTLQWSLDAWQNVDFSQLSLLPESAFAPLSVGLLSALADVALSRDLFCSGQWDEEQCRWHVNNQTLLRKLQQSLDLGYRRFVVPASSKATVENFLKLHETAVESLQTKTLQDATDLDTALAGVLVIGGSSPQPDDPLPDRESWYDSLRDEESAREFYETHLLSDAIRVAKDHLGKGELAGWSPQTLVSIVSHSAELIKLASLMFAPKHCVLIHTGGSIGKSVTKLTQWFDESSDRPGYADPNSSEVPDDVDSLEKIVSIVGSLPRNIDPATGSSGVLLDVTPGKRTMTLAILQAAQQGDRILCWWHDTSRYNRRAKPLSIQPLIWQVQVSGGLVPLCPQPLNRQSSAASSLGSLS
jgi:hypothetical protein